MKKQLIHQQICPILGIRQYTPLVDNLRVVVLCLRLNARAISNKYTKS